MCLKLISNRLETDPRMIINRVANSLGIEFLNLHAHRA